MSQRCSRFFRKGEKLALTAEHIDVIFSSVIDELNRIGRKYFGVNLRFNFEERMV